MSKQSSVYIRCLLFISVIMPVRSLLAQEKNKHAKFHLEWSELPPLPSLNGAPNLGVAGAFSGISNNVMLLAGGANFPAAPARNGGTKKYWDKVYALPLQAGEKISWLKKELHFPFPVAYGASVTMKEGIVCIGGKNDAGPLAEVSLMQWDEKIKDIRIVRLPPLPQSLASPMADHIGDVLYVAGGDNDRQTQKSFYFLDLHRSQNGWQSLPAWPGPPLADGVLVAQSNGKQVCLYLVGGRNSIPGKLSAYYNAVYEFNPTSKKWKKKKGITGVNRRPVPLFAGTAAAIDKQDILLLGGNDGKLFTQIEQCNLELAGARDAREKDYWQERKDSIFTHHPGFDRTLYLYNTVTNSWKTAGALKYPAQVTTAAVRYGDYIIIPNGEVRPGIRTPDIIAGKMEW